MPQCSRLLAKDFLYCFVFLFIKFGSLVNLVIKSAIFSKIIFFSHQICIEESAITKIPYMLSLSCKRIYVIVKEFLALFLHQFHQLRLPR